jgi:DNA-binding response OmpR family regulator
MSRPLRSVVVVGGRQGRAPNLHNLLADTNDYDVIFVESIARGYSRIKQVTPDFVIVVLGIDDVAACQLLSMMKIDRDVSRIPMVTWARQREESELEDEIAEWDQDSPRWSLAVPMN